MRSALLTTFIALAATSLHAAPPVPDSVVWQEAIEYSKIGRAHV